MPNTSNIASNRTQLSLALGIPLEHVKAAKALNCPAMSYNGRVNVDEFKRWYVSHKDSILEYLEDSKDNKAPKGTWKERKERALALIAEIELKERQGNTLDKNKTIGSVNSIFNSMAIMLRDMAKDYPPKLLGKNINEMQVILSKMFDEICEKGIKAVGEWKT